MPKRSASRPEVAVGCHSSCVLCASATWQYAAVVV